MFNFSTGMIKALLAGDPSISTKVMADTISAGDGDGTGGLDTINDSASGFGSFGRHDFLLIVSGDANDGVWTKCINASAAKLEVPAGALTAVAAGSVVGIFKFDAWGAMKTLFQNCTIDIYAEARPASADSAEPGAAIARFTLNGDAFVAGLSTNGLNFGYLDGTNMKRAIDPETSIAEVWRATPTVTAVANSCRIYANDKSSGSSTTAIRMDGVVATSGADLNISQGPSLTAGVPVDISDVVNQVRSGNVV
jgi:hypothetical protein